MFYIKDIKRKTIVATYDDENHILEINGESQKLSESLHEYLVFALECFSNEKKEEQSYKPEDFSRTLSSAAISNKKRAIKKKFGDVDIFSGNTKNVELNPNYIVFESNDMPESSAMEYITLYIQNIIEVDSTGNELTIGKNTETDKLKDKLDNDTVCVCGDGGIGKTEFLKRMYISLKSFGKIVYIISLPMLLRNALNNHIQESKLTDNIAVNGGYSLENCYNSYIMQFINNDSEPGIKEKTFFLFDGMNELLEQRKPGTFTVIERIVHEIESLCKSEKTSVIITSRSFKTTADCLKDIKFRQWQVEPLNEHIPDSAFSSDISEENKHEILEWLRRPLFYCMYMQMLEEENLRKKQEKRSKKENPEQSQNNKTLIPATQYKFLKKFYLFFYMQTIKNKNYIDETEHMTLFFFIIPLIACIMQKNREKFLSVNELREMMIDSLPESHREKSLITSVINRVRYDINRDINFINGISDTQAEKYMEMLVNLDMVSFSERKGRKEFRFSHDIWSEFLCSFYIINYIGKIEDVTDCRKYIPSFNLQSSVQEIIMRELDIQPVTENMIKYKPDEVKKTQDNFRKIFTDDNNILFEEIKTDKIPKYLRDKLDILYIAFELSDNFRLHITDTFGELAEEFISYLIELSDKKNNMENIFDNEQKVFLLKILSAMFQYYRERKTENPNENYSMCHTLYLFATDKLKSNAFRNSGGKEYLAYCLLRHAYAKALLFEGRELISESIRKEEGIEKFKEAFSILEQNKTFNMSANLLGCIYATPVRFLLENKLIKPDVTKAFDVYNSSYREMTGKTGKIFTLTGTELIYTCRQLLGFILKGYIQVINIPDGEMAVENTNKSIPDENSLNFCKKVIDDIEGQYITFVNWLRGIHKAYAKGVLEYKSIQGLLEKEDSNYMTIIIKFSNIAGLRSEFVTGSDEKISAKGRKALEMLDTKISDLIKDIGSQQVLDRTDTYYMLRDAVILIDVLENISQKNDTIICNEIKEIRTRIVSSENYIEFEKLLS